MSNPSQQLRSIIGEAVRQAMDDIDAWKTCINCIHFHEHQEVCDLVTPPMRPPAKVIAFGCDSFVESDIPF